MSNSSHNNQDIVYGIKPDTDETFSIIKKTSDEYKPADLPSDLMDRSEDLDEREADRFLHYARIGREAVIEICHSLMGREAKVAN